MNLNDKYRDETGIDVHLIMENYKNWLSNNLTESEKDSLKGKWYETEKGTYVKYCNCCSSLEFKSFLYDGYFLCVGCKKRVFK